jgi:hypothetical protein
MVNHTFAIAQSNLNFSLHVVRFELFDGFGCEVVDLLSSQYSLVQIVESMSKVVISSTNNFTW